MPTQIGYDGTRDFWIFVVAFIVLVGGAAFAVIPDAHKRASELAEYCKPYAETSRSEIPAKCVEYYE